MVVGHKINLPNLCSQHICIKRLAALLRLVIVIRINIHGNRAYCEISKSIIFGIDRSRIPASYGEQLPKD